ncbi:hypothetical protein CDD83_10933 [Cordyceps sp. RAO-2017]|nr:hypothetical protein CDD83_10933 [Cordyceps sp. RAO-2017]
MSSSPLLDPSVFAELERELEAETAAREALAQLVARLERAVAAAQGVLARVHSTPRSAYAELVARVEAAVADEVVLVKQLAETASQHPYYKYNGRWTRTMQAAIGTVLLGAWLGGFGAGEIGRVLTLDEVGAILAAPTNLKDRDAFHLTIEEYLLALADLASDLARLAANAVTLADYALPPLVAAFARDLLAGFQLLHLRNDALRRRADAVKYDVKRAEDVVYDLSLRGLLPGP